MPNEEKNKEEKKGSEDKAKKEALDMAFDQIERQFGTGAIMRFGQKESLKIDAIPSGSVSLDLALGVGGYPRGRIIEIFGPESGGKTTLALHICGQAQKLGGVAAYIDVEHALDPDYAKRLGVNVDELLISQPDSATIARLQANCSVWAIWLKRGCGIIGARSRWACSCPRSRWSWERSWQPGCLGS